MIPDLCIWQWDSCFLHIEKYVYEIASRSRYLFILSLVLSAPGMFLLLFSPGIFLCNTYVYVFRSFLLGNWRGILSYLFSLFSFFLPLLSLSSLFFFHFFLSSLFFFSIRINLKTKSLIAFPSSHHRKTWQEVVLIGSRRCSASPFVLNCLDFNICLPYLRDLSICEVWTKRFLRTAINYSAVVLMCRSSNSRNDSYIVQGPKRDLLRRESGRLLWYSLWILWHLVEFEYW